MSILIVLALDSLIHGMTVLDVYSDEDATALVKAIVSFTPPSLSLIFEDCPRASDPLVESLSKGVTITQA